MPELVLIMDNLRSAHNVGTILRTADGAGLKQVYLCGTTPSPNLQGDVRPPYAQARAAKEISKTALGAEKSLELHYDVDTLAVLDHLKQAGYNLVALEQSERSIPLHEYQQEGPIALIVGNEVQGIAQPALAFADQIVEIPMHGSKESLNVAVATGIALYMLTLAK